MKNVHQRHIILVVVAVLLLTTPVLLKSRLVYGVYKYGYQKGDTYFFNVDMSSTANTQEGESKSSTSYGVTFKIEDIDEDTNGHRVDIKYLQVSTMANLEDGNQIIYEGHVEGDPQPFTSGYGSHLGAPVALFITTDWDQRGDEWKDYVKTNFENKPGYNVQSRTESDGVFTANINLDAAKSESTIDFDGDGNKDAYTGTVSIKVEYDSNGVLSSASYQSNLKFSDKDSESLSMNASRGQPFIGFDVLMYILVVVIGILAFFAGLFLGRRSVASREMASPSQSAPQ